MDVRCSGARRLIIDKKKFKIEDPRLSIEREPALRAIARLLLTDGVA